MKHIVLAALAAIISLQTALAGAVQTDKDHHALVEQWKRYELAERQDLPEDMLNALESIIDKAGRERLDWDFYDATLKWAEIKSRLNWKDRRAAEARKGELLQSYDSPAIRLLTTNDIASYKLERQALEKGSNPGFHYSGLWDIPFKKQIVGTLKNDYEWALWYVFSKSGKSEDIKQYYSDRYPESLLIRYIEIKRGRIYDGVSRKDALQKLYQDYRGRAGAMIPEADLLSIRYDSLMNAEAKEAQFLALLDECNSYEKRRSSLKAADKALLEDCNTVKMLINTLKRPELSGRVNGGRITIVLRNMSSVKLFLYPEGSKKALLERVLKVESPHFYVTDTVNMDLPPLNDGYYDIKLQGAGLEDNLGYRCNSLSVAIRSTASAMQVYVADAVSGRPVEQCELYLKLSGRNAYAAKGEYSFNGGYSPVPQQIIEAMTEKDETYALLAKFRDSEGMERMSRECVISRGLHLPETIKEDKELQCKLLLDRSVAKAGESVNFKLILFRGRYEAHSCPGESVEVIMSDPDGKKSSMNLVCGPMSSADGAFALGHPERMGTYSFAVRHDGRTLCSESLKMIDNELPSFDLKWGKCSKMVLPGDMMYFSGKVNTLSGHTLPQDACQYVVSSQRKELSRGRLKLASDGSFDLAIRSSEDTYDWAKLVLRITDSNGETREFRQSVMSASYFALPYELSNCCKGQVNDEWRSCIVAEDRLVLDLSQDSGRWGLDARYLPQVKTRWSLVSEADTLLRGDYGPAGSRSISLASLAPGKYEICLNASVQSESGKIYKSEWNRSFWYFDKAASTLPAGVENLIYIPDEESRRVLVGASEAGLWLLADVYGAGGEVLKESLLKANIDAASQICSLELADKTGDLTLNLSGFKKYRSIKWQHIWKGVKERQELPLAFARISDSVRPGERVHIQLQSEPGVECAVTVYDEGKDMLFPNRWQPVRLWERPLNLPAYDLRPGCNGAEYGAILMRSMGAKAMSQAVSADMAVEEETMANDAPAQDEELGVREDFSENLCWEPHLLTGPDGRASLDFKASDRLSRFVVKVFAHDKDMRTAVLNGSMVVSIPVRLSHKAPAALYAGADICTLPVGLANSTARTLGGALEAEFYNGDDYKALPAFARSRSEVVIGPYASQRLKLALPQLPGECERMGVLLRFRPEQESIDAETNASDAVFFAIDLRAPVQLVKEAHSALYRTESERQRVETELRGKFVNFDGSQIKSRSVDIAQLLKEALPEVLEAKSDNAVDLSAALYASVLARRLGAASSEANEKSLLERLERCFVDGGGVCWFVGMNPTPIVTALVLERLYDVRELGYALPASLENRLAESVRYLDVTYFNRAGNNFRHYGALSIAQYLHLRSLFPQVRFERDLCSRKALKAFRKEAAAYLAPNQRQGLDGAVLLKARRAETISALLSDKTLLRSWRIRTISSRMRRSYQADLASLVQYVRPHWSGGNYCPNAVMPWRGLLESELNAHTTLCSLLEKSGYKELADGIRLWIMVQKESQKWDSDPAYIEALACVYGASEEVLATRVLVLEAEGPMEMSDIKPAGNDMSIDRNWYIIEGGSDYLAEVKRDLKEGDRLKIGDKVVVEYKIWNRENRSFAHLSAERPNCMSPVNILSGIMRGGVYRSVGASRSDFWIELLPEEDYVIREEFYVCAEGSFICPPVSVESCYAPHYRANDDASRRFVVEN